MLAYNDSIPGPILAMNRLRHAYLKIAPALEPYFTTGHHDDEQGLAASYLRQAGYLAAFQLASPMDPTGPQWTIRRIMVTPTWRRATLLDRITHSF
jgi:hypothetical protein